MQHICKTKDGKTNLPKYIEEYISKQNLFNPDKSSPNRFIHKLEHRLKIYYNDMISNKSEILHKK